MSTQAEHFDEINTNTAERVGGRPASLKRLGVISLGSGFGLALGAGLLVLAVSWYQSRPTPPEPWNAKSVVSTFDSVRTEGEQNTVLLRYVIENRSDKDYRLSDTDGAQIMVRLRKKNGPPLLSAGFTEFLSLEYPIFVPPGQSQLVYLHFSYPVPIKSPPNATKDQEKAFENQVVAHLKESFETVDGFVLFDHRRRYQVNLPKPW